MDKQIVRTGLFIKKANLTQVEFRDYWHYHHAAIASGMAGMMKYDQNHVVKKVNLRTIPSTGRECDGMSQIWFESMNSQRSNDPETMNRLAIDEHILFQTMDLVVCETVNYCEMVPGTPFIKYMCFAKKAENISEQEYAEKLEAAARSILSIPACIEYRAGNVVERLICNAQGDRSGSAADEKTYAHPSWMSASYEDVPIDSLLEIYFRFSDKTAIGDPFDNPEGNAALEKLHEIFSEVSCYITDVQHIVNKYI